MVQSKIIHVNTTFLNTESTDALKNYADEKVTSCLKKYVHHDTEVHVVLKVAKNRHIAEATFNVDGGNFSCTEESTDLYVSIDALTSALSNQLRKHKEKLTKHH